MIYNNILEAMGHTPMVRLSRMHEPGSADILVKVEALNVGGSIKTRTALNMIEEAEDAGLLGPDSVIVEPTSGNQGIGLALVGAVKGYRTVIIMPDSVSIERRALVQHYGAELRLVHDAGDIGQCIEECVETAMRMKQVFLDDMQHCTLANEHVSRHPGRPFGRRLWESITRLLSPLL